MLNHSQCESLNSKGVACPTSFGGTTHGWDPPKNRLMLLDGRCRVIGVASTLILLIKANGNICETLRKVPEVHPEDALAMCVH